MKGQIIDDEEEPKESREVGIGIECPDCGADMSKSTTVKIKADYMQDKGMKTSAGRSVVKWTCPECGYCEEVV